MMKEAKKIKPMKIKIRQMKYEDEQGGWNLQYQREENIK